MTAGKCNLETKIRAAGLRPTRQRIALADLLFSNGNRHITAETLHIEALENGTKVSLATIYNNLHQFTEAGLLREVIVDASKSYFDTNTSTHHHFFFEDDGSLEDIPADELKIGNIPELPVGTEVTSVDVIIRVKRM